MTDGRDLRPIGLSPLDHTESCLHATLRATGRRRAGTGTACRRVGDTPPMKIRKIRRSVS